MIISREIYFLGYSGHALVVHDCLTESDRVMGYYDLRENFKNPLELQFKGHEENLVITEENKNAYFFPAVGSNDLRKKLLELVERQGLHCTTIVHQNATVSNHSEIAEGCLVGPNAIVNSMAIIGRGCIINSGAIIEHECTLGDFVHIAPGTVLCGNVEVGEMTFIGANSVIKEGIRIGKNVIIGAGSVVLKDVPDNAKIAGVPAKDL